MVVVSGPFSGMPARAAAVPFGGVRNAVSHCPSRVLGGRGNGILEFLLPMDNGVSIHAKSFASQGFVEAVGERLVLRVSVLSAVSVYGF